MVCEINGVQIAINNSADPQRKAAVYQPDMSQTVTSLTSASFSARWVKFVTRGDHSRRFRRLMKVTITSPSAFDCTSASTHPACRLVFDIFNEPNKPHNPVASARILKTEMFTSSHPCCLRCNLNNGKKKQKKQSRFPRNCKRKIPLV